MDFVIRTGDLIKINITPPAVVGVLSSPIPLNGSGTRMNISGLPVCLEGDELPPSVRGPLAYTAPPYVIPGTGTLKIILLADNLAARTRNMARVLLKAGTFQAVFEVSTPAQMPTPGGPQPDPVAMKPGTAGFISTADLRVRAT